jgi:hypothetical protein
MQYIEFILKIKVEDIPTILGAYGYQPVIDGVQNTELPTDFIKRKIIEVPTEKMVEYLAMEQARIAQMNTPRPPEIIVEVD